jgi:hypothetical protein
MYRYPSWSDHYRQTLHQRSDQFKRKAAGPYNYGRPKLYDWDPGTPQDIPYFSATPQMRREVGILGTKASKIYDPLNTTFFGRCPKVPGCHPVLFFECP